MSSSLLSVEICLGRGLGRERVNIIDDNVCKPPDRHLICNTQSVLPTNNICEENEKSAIIQVLADQGKILLCSLFLLGEMQTAELLRDLVTVSNFPLYTTIVPLLWSTAKWVPTQICEQL